MPAFPAIHPNSISFTHGEPQVSEYNSFGVGPIRFRHDKLLSLQSYTFEFQNIQQADIDLIRDHYIQSGGTASTFTVPSAIFGGIDITDSDAQFRYVDTPAEEHFGVYFNVRVTLEAIRGVNPTFILDAGDATLPAEAAFSKFVFDGTAPFILKGTTSASATLILNGD